MQAKHYISSTDRQTDKTAESDSQTVFINIYKLSSE